MKSKWKTLPLIAAVLAMLVLPMALAAQSEMHAVFGFDDFDIEEIAAAIVYLESGPLRSSDPDDNAQELYDAVTPHIRAYLDTGDPRRYLDEAFAESFGALYADYAAERAWLSSQETWRTEITRHETTAMYMLLDVVASYVPVNEKTME